MNNLPQADEGFMLLHGPFDRSVEKDGSVFIRIKKDKSGFKFDNVREYEHFVEDEIIDFIHKNPWHKKFTDAERILSSF